MLLDTIFILLFVLVPLVVVLILPYAGVSFRRFSVPSFFLIFYIVSNYIGIFFLYFKLDEYSAVTLGVSDDAAILKLFFYSSTALITLVCGLLFARTTLGLHVEIMYPKIPSTTNTKQRFIVFCLFMICGLVLVSYIRSIESVALLKLFQGDHVGAYAIRGDMGNAFEGKYWRYELFFHYLLNYCVFFFLADYLTQKRCASALLFIACFLLAAFSAVMSIEKTPLITLLIALYLTYISVKDNLYWRPMTKYLVLLLVSITFIVYVYFIGGMIGLRSFSYVVTSIVSRVFAGQITSAYAYLDLFPKEIDFLWGSSLPNPGGILPFSNFPLTTVVANAVCPECSQMGIVGSSPAVFWAEMYANFGLLGVVLSSFFLGIFLSLISHILAKIRPSVPMVAATVSLALHYQTLTGTSLSGIFFDTTLLAIVIVTFLLLRVGQCSRQLE